MQQQNTIALPGLVKGFLVYAYLLIVCCVLWFIAVEILSPRYLRTDTLWQIGPLVIGVCALIAVLGIHTRAQWAPLVCRCFCFVQLAVFVAGGFLVEGDVLSYGFGSHGGYDGLTFVFMCGASASVSIPILIGWFCYFGNSAHVLAAFNLPPKETAWHLPPLGVGLLQVLCGMYFLAGVSIIVFPLLLQHPEMPMAAFSFGVAWWPHLIFPVILVCFTARPGASALTVCRILWAWLLCAAFMSMGIWIKLATLLSLDIPLLINFYYGARNVPFQNIVLVVFAAALSWRFLADPEEGRWLVQAEQKGAVLYGRLPLLAFAALYLAFYYAPFASSKILLLPMGLIVGVVVLLTAGERLDVTKQYLAVQNRDIIVFCVLALCIAGFSINQGMHSRDMMRTFTVYMPRHILHIGLCVFGILTLQRKKIDAQSPLAMPLPVGAFYVFCFCVVAKVLFSLPSGVYSIVSTSSGTGDFLFSPAFWVESIVCPLLVISMFRRGAPSSKGLMAVCAVWLAASFFREIHVLWGAGRSPYVFPYALSRDWQGLASVLALFMMYLPYSREFAQWRRIRGGAPA
ncbi:MAG: hypothetical protein DELT_01418 [Desulfovibrio sp.]